MLRVLFVCSANTGRSALAGAMSRALVDEHRLPVEISSAGTSTAGGELVSPLVAEVAHAFGADLSGYLSRALTVEALRDVDLAVGMTGEHREHVVGIKPGMAARAFVLRPLVGGMQAQGARRADEPVAGYLLRVSAARPADTAADLADPYGRPVEVLWAAARELDSLVRELLGHLFPDAIQGRLKKAGQ
jgi:protein-tyrosine-phosphatase